jgi:predicted ATPase/class 3 adenylate cyclase
MALGLRGSLASSGDGQLPRVLPVGTVTLLLADQQGSSRAWELDERSMRATTPRLNELVDREVGRHDGVRPVEQGEGDSFVAAFDRASDATSCALAIQFETQAPGWPGGFQPRLRMALHTGEVELRDAGNYMGPSLNRCGRLRSLAAGGQVLVSRTTADLLLDTLPPGASLLDLGPHRLRGFDREEVIFQLCHPDLPTDFPLLPLEDAAPRVVPVGTPPIPLTRTIGRERDIRDVATMLREGVRLLTFTGPGGVGKTRLALEVAREVADDFRHGVYFLPLASIEDPSLLLGALAQANGIAVEGRAKALDAVIEYLRTRQVLLVLDNFEHLLAAAPPLAAILDACPRAQALVTSRQLLRVRGELAYEVGPLATPPAARAHVTVESVTESPAVQLLVERATQASAPVVITDVNAAAIGELCRRLDGLPLAIELAAARMRLLPPAALLSRLDQRLDVLTAGAVNAAERHRTLRAAIDWSHDLMSDWERTVFARLSVFAGGCTLEVADQVCRRPGDPDLLDAVSSLVEQSLVVAGSMATEPRLGMLESVRAYAWERLAERGETDELQVRHLAWVRGILDESFVGMCGSGQRMWTERLDHERDNIREAMRYAIRTGDAASASRVALDSFVYLSIRDSLPELRDWVDQSEPLVATAPTQVRAIHHLAGALCAVGLGEQDLARRYAADLDDLERAESLEGDLALWTKAILADEAGDDARAADLLNRAWELSIRLGNDWAVGYIESTLGDRALRRTDIDEASSRHERALAIARQISNAPLAGHSQTRLALVALLRGDTAAVVTHLQDAAAIFRATGYRSGLLFCVDSGIIAAARLGQPRVAANALGALAAVRGRSGASVWPTMQPMVDDAERCVRRELGEERYAEARAEGTTDDLDACVATLLVGLREAVGTT